GLSISGQIVKPYATAAKIPFFCICSVSSVGDELYTFTTMPLAEDEATQWVAEAKRRGIKRIARLTQDYPSIDNHVRALKVEAAPAGITFVYEDRFEASTADFNPASRLRNAHLPTSILSRRSTPPSICSANTSRMRVSEIWHPSSRSQSA